MPIGLDQFDAFEQSAADAEPTTLDGFSVGAQYIMKTEDTFRPKIGALTTSPGKHLLVMVTSLKKDFDGDTVAEVELLGPQEHVGRFAQYPNLEALENISLSTTCLIESVPVAHLTVAPNPLDKAELKLRRENLETLNVGLAAYMGHIPHFVQIKETAKRAMARREELAFSDPSLGAPSAKRTKLLDSQKKGGSEGGGSDSEAVESTGKGKGPVRSSGPSPSQVTGRSEGGIRAFDQALDQNEAGRSDEGVPGHLVFTQPLDLSVEKGVSVPLAVIHTKYDSPHFICMQEPKAALVCMYVCMQGCPPSGHRRRRVGQR